MKHLLLAVAGAASIVTAPAFAGTGSVASRYAHWEQQLRERVNELHVYPEAANGATGDVLVGFRIGPDGKPMNISVVASSGSQILDNAAAQLVSRLGRLGQVPSNSGRAWDVTLKLSYGDGSNARQSMQLERADRAERFANEQRARALVAAAEANGSAAQGR